jgi:aminoglycoside phosphotransferase
MAHRQTAWQSPGLFFQKIEDLVEEAEEASRVRALKKARKAMQAQLEREAARKIWVRGEQVELPPTPPPR